MGDIRIAHLVKGYALWASKSLNVCAISGLCRGSMIVWRLKRFIPSLRAVNGGAIRTADRQAVLGTGLWF
jgi:hypothetical protein